MANPMPGEMIYTVAEVAKICKTDKNTIYKEIKEGLIDTLQIGKTKISVQSLENYIRLKEEQARQMRQQNIV